MCNLDHSYCKKRIKLEFLLEKKISWLKDKMSKLRKKNGEDPFSCR
jgi:hypothetical protein